MVVEATHLDQLREHGGLLGLRNEQAFETALARPKQKWNFDWETGLALRAAAYAFGLSSARAWLAAWCAVGEARFAGGQSLG